MLLLLAARITVPWQRSYIGIFTIRQFAHILLGMIVIRRSGIIGHIFDLIQLVDKCGGVGSGIFR